MNEETIPQMRERIERLEKQLGDATAAARDLVTENKVLKTEKVFGQLGFNPVQAALYVKSLGADDEVTPEGVTKFASEFGLSPMHIADEAPNEEEGNPVDEAMALFGSGGSTGGGGGGDSAGAKRMTNTEYMELLRRDPAAAAAAVAQKRVAVREDNPFAFLGS